MKTQLRNTALTLVAAMTLSSASHAAPLKVGYSDWPGYTIMEIAKQKGWFKDAGLDVDMVWFEYAPSLDALSAGKIDGNMMVAGDVLVIGATGAKSKITTLLDYTDGNDMVIGAPGITSMKDLKGKKVGVEITLVEHLLLLEALKQNGMTQKDVTLVGTATDKTPQALASGQVSAVAAWYPISGQVLDQVPGSTKLFTSAQAPGLIYDVLTVNPSSYAAHKEDWAKIAAIYYKCVDYLKDPKTHDDAVKIMAAKVGVDPTAYGKNLPGTHFLTLAEAKQTIKKGDGLDSIYGSLAVGDKFNIENGVYKQSQKPANYVAPGIIEALK